MRRTALLLSLAAALALPGLADGHGGKHKAAHFTAPASEAAATASVDMPMAALRMGYNKQREAP